MNLSASPDEPRDGAQFLDEHQNILAMARQLYDSGEHDDVIGVGRKFGSYFDAYSLWEGWKDLASVSLAAARAVHDDEAAAGFLVELANVASEQGDFPTAHEHANAALRLASELGATGVMGDAEAAIGNAYTRAGATELAVEHFEAALAHYAVGNDPKHSEKVLNNLANCKKHLGDVDGAITDLERLLRLRQERGESLGCANVLTNLSAAHLARHDPASALAAADQAIALYRALRVERELAMAIANKGNALLMIGSPTEAIEQLALARQIFEEIGDAQAADLATRYLTRARAAEQT